MQNLSVNHKILPFVKDIILLKDENDTEHRLPFYADGYPGIIYSKTREEMILYPMKKSLPDFFLYGQTVEPIELRITGPYKMIVFQLYPFATRILLNINPKEITDACFDLYQIESVDTNKTASELLNKDIDNQIQILSDYILELVKNSTSDPDNSIKLAISTIIKSKGNIPIKQLREQLYITERTFERKFNNEIGVTPKQFAKIIQFSFSLNQIKETDYTSLTNIAYENGYTDQSHFIRSFKKYTGATPKELLAKLG